MSQFILFFLLALTLLPASASVNPDKLSPTLTPAKQSLAGRPVYLRIFKEESQVELYVLRNKRYQLVETYPICRYSGGLGPKKRENDLRSPEGFYQTDANSLNPNSRFHLSFNIGYPNPFDASHGYTGNLLMIHGGCVSEGCYAIGDNNIEELFYFINQAINHGQETVDIHIFPFKMSESNLSRHRLSEHYDFWRQLKPAFDYFEKNKMPPFIYISEGKYFIFPHLPASRSD
jgi:murein L,D-transpeptidase YafK